MRPSASLIKLFKSPNSWVVALAVFGFLELILVRPLSAAPSADDPIRATFRLTPAGKVVAYTQFFSGSIQKTKDGVFQSESIEVPLERLVTDNALRDSHMHKKYLQTENYPKAVLTQLRASAGKFTAQLSLHGKEGAVSGEYQIEGKKVRAQFPLSLKAFGIEAPSYLLVRVKDEGVVEVNLPFNEVERR